MSFAIAAVYKKGEVYLAADTQHTGKLSGKVEHGKSKIFDISKSIAISCCGNVDFCEKCVKTLQTERQSKQHVSVNASDIARDFCKCITEVDLVWSKETFGIAPEAVFLVAGYDMLNPYVTIIIHRNHKLKQYNEVWRSGEYQFVAVPPSNMILSDCIELGIEHFHQHDTAQTSPEATLEALVKKVAELSEFVNDQVEIWKALPLFGLR